MPKSNYMTLENAWTIPREIEYYESRRVIPRGPIKLESSGDIYTEHFQSNTPKLSEEINSFQSIWKGGFRTGYNEKRNQIGIEKYLKENMEGKCCLEIGCGGGQWSKFIYNLNIFDKIYCIDILPEKHNKFWEYVGKDKNDKIEYIHINDFSLDGIPSACLDYVFSYDVFCHISYSGQKEYLKNLYKKCKPNCKLFIMYADPQKYILSEPEHLSHMKAYIPNKGADCKTDKELINACLLDKDGDPKDGRWYWIGISNFINLCLENKYKILNTDLNIDKTNPITLFIK
jgi:SAM-dependent methyltransferase